MVAGGETLSERKLIANWFYVHNVRPPTALKLFDISVYFYFMVFLLQVQPSIGFNLNYFTATIGAVFFSC
jgi:hypothetical protein